MLKIFGGTSERPKVKSVNDPFKGKHVKGLSLFVTERRFDKGEFGFTGNIEFKNGLTEGKQRFKADNLDNLVTEMYRLLKEFSE